MCLSSFTGVLSISKLHSIFYFEFIEYFMAGMCSISERVFELDIIIKDGCVETSEEGESIVPFEDGVN